MEPKTLLNRITVDPEICHGKPCIRGMRWPVEVILGLLASGMSFAEILAEHPELDKLDIIASLTFAKLSISSQPLLAVA